MSNVNRFRGIQVVAVLEGIIVAGEIVIYVVCSCKDNKKDLYLY